MIVRVATIVLLAVGLSACGGPGIFAMGTVTGHVMIRACGGAYQPDQTGCQTQPAAGARISFQSNGRNTALATADSSGTYRIDLRPGTYSVDVQHQGTYRVAAPRQVTVTAGKTVTVDFTYVENLL